MAKAKLKISLPCSVSALWRVVTDNTDSSWRSDLSRIEVLDERRFVEYTTKGYPTHFTVTAFEPCKHYAFDMENGNMKGRWEGLFSEEAAPKKFFMRPFIGPYLKKQQARYAADLEKELMKEK